ncbi:MAG: hypothetical protein CMD33_09895, partial [Flavobacteriales bacterium]|nr:hypothetical protein [Flavobacteriales bacterium]
MNLYFQVFFSYPMNKRKNNKMSSKEEQPKKKTESKKLSPLAIAAGGVFALSVVALVVYIARTGEAPKAKTPYRRP